MSGDPNLPGDSAADRDVTRRWREQSTEQPSPASDARIRAAAREAVRAERRPSPPDAALRGGRWSRLVPLAAAASVALLAIGLVRLIPRDEYQAIPVTREDTLRPDVAPEAAAPAAPATTPASPPVKAEIVDEAERSAAADASVSSQAEESREQLRAAREPTAAAGDHARRLESAEQATREAPAVTQGVPAYAAPPAAAAPAPAEAAPSAPTAITTTSARAAKGADGAAPLPAELTRRVRDDAARRAAVDPATIRIVAVDPVLWFDTSLGCEAGAMAAPEMRVPGYVVTVDAAGAELRYHTDDRERFRICGDD